MIARALRRLRQPCQPLTRACVRCQGQPSREELRREGERTQRENQELRRKIAEREKQISEQENQIRKQEKEIAEREKQISDLERQLAASQKNSTNSSKPPSSDGLAGKSRPRGRGKSRNKKKRRKPGGQKTIEAWHEKLGIATQRVTVGANDSGLACSPSYLAGSSGKHGHSPDECRGCGTIHRSRAVWFRLD